MGEGHAGHPENERCDTRAVGAITIFRENCEFFDKFNKLLKFIPLR
jgi:ribonuclease HI